MNSPHAGLRFLFAQHYKGGLSVISVARLSDLNFGAKLTLGSTSRIFQQLADRTEKLINKGLGQGYYGYALSTDRNSVMFAPVMSLADLDSVGSWYTSDDVARAASVR